MADEGSTTEAATYPRGFARDTDWKWPMVPARKLVTLNYGRALKADTRSPGNVPVFGTNGQCGWHNAPLAKAPGLILGRKGQGPLGVEWCEKDFWVIDTAYYASTLTPNLDLKYLYHLVKYVGLNHLKDGTSNPTLSRDTFGAQLFPLPPLVEQRAIAAVLGALDDKIELNRRMNTTLEAMARALFQSWFVDFDPVRAKLDGRKPTGLDPTTAALFPASFQDSELGPIPQGWAVDTIKSGASNIQYGFTQSASNEPIGPQFLRITDLCRGNIDWSSVPFCQATDDETKKYRVMDGDVFIARTGASTGDNIYVVEPPKAVFASYLIRIQFASRGLGRVVGEFTRTADYVNHVAGTIGGSAQPNASAQALAAASMLFPTEEIADAFYRTVRPMDLRRAANDRESRILATLRDTLVPKLLSGELRTNTRP